MARNARIEADSKDIAEKLMELIGKAPAGGLFHAAEVEKLNRNSFCLRLDPAGPIVTVSVQYGGAITST